MASTVCTEIQINGTPEQVWGVISDLEQYEQWNPFLKKAQGVLKEGGELVIEMQLSGKKPMTFRPKVTKSIKNKELRWVGHLVVPGVFDGEHSFLIEPTDGEYVKLVQCEKFKGVISGILGKKFYENVEKSFDLMNQAVARKVEKEQAEI